MKKYLEILLIVVTVMFGLSTISACTQTKGVAPAPSVPIGIYNPSVAKPIDYPPPAEFKQSLPLATYKSDRDIEMDPKKWVEDRPTSPAEFKQSLPLARYNPTRDIKMEPNWVDTGNASKGYPNWEDMSAVHDACPEGGCGNRNSNPKWRFVSQNYFGGVPVIYGNINKEGGPWIQSKWYAPGKEVQVIVTNWDGRSDISSRLAAAQEEAKRIEGKIRSGQLKYNCGQNHCYVCEH